MTVRTRNATTSKKAPLFSLSDQSGAEVALAKISSDFTVLYFYPKDDTPGCTIEAQEFTAANKEFKRRGISVYGISGGDVRSKEKFCGKYNLTIPLLADPSFSVAKKFGAFGQKSFMGRTYQGIFRQTFVLDRAKRIIKVFESVSPKGHAKEVLEYIDQVARGSSSAKAKPTASKVKTVRRRSPLRSRAPVGPAKRSTGRKSSSSKKVMMTKSSTRASSRRSTRSAKRRTSRS